MILLVTEDDYYQKDHFYDAGDDAGDDGGDYFDDDKSEQAGIWCEGGKEDQTWRHARDWETVREDKY